MNNPKKIARIDLKLIHEEHKESARLLEEWGQGWRHQRRLLRDELTSLLDFTSAVRSFAQQLISEMAKGEQSPLDAEGSDVLLEGLANLRQREGSIVMQIQELTDD